MNKWIGMGRLCSDPEIRNTDSGKAVANYRLAVNRDFKKEGQPDADFLNCVAFGNSAEFASKYLHKGTKIAVEGRIQTRDYTNKDGQKVYVTEIVVDRHEFCESKKASTQDAEPDYSPSPVPFGGTFALEENEDVLPF